jgi:hypothetical protein
MIVYKRGAEQMLSIYWFAILIIVAGGIFAMVSVFYSHPSDVRIIESNLLLNHVADCLSWNGQINPGLLSKGNFSEEFKENFLSKCSLNFEAEREWEVPQYYIQINFYKFDFQNNSVFEIVQGNKNLKEDCKIENNEDFGKISKCVERIFYSLDSDKNQYLIKILSVVKKTEKNAK